MSAGANTDVQTPQTREARHIRVCSRLYEGVSLLHDGIPSNVATLSADGLGERTATINQHLSADLWATRRSLRRPPHATVLNSCPVHSILPTLPPSSAFCHCSSQSSAPPLYLLLTRRSLKSQCAMQWMPPWLGVREDRDSFPPVSIREMQLSLLLSLICVALTL